MTAKPEVAALAKALPRAKVLASPDELARYAADRWPRAALARRAGDAPTLPLAVVKAEAEDDVVAALRWAAAARVGVVPFGAGCGVCGGASGLAGAITLDVRGLDAVVGIDAESHTVKAGAGVIGSVLEEALAAQGLTLGHYPQSLPLSTLGGFLATRSSGQMSTKYGNIEDLTLGLRVVLADGGIIEVGASPRRSTGPDLKGLFIGSEGTLGVITQATMSVHASPAARELRCFAFDDPTDGLAACRGILTAGLRPALLRFYDAKDAGLVLSAYGIEADASILMLACEGHEGVAAAEADACAAVARAHGGDDIGKSPVERWLAKRYEVPVDVEAMIGGGAVLDTLEVSALWRDVPRVHAEVGRALEDAGFTAMAHLSHGYESGAGLYFTMLAFEDDAERALAMYDDAWRRAMEATLAAGASVSHHHGIGRQRARFLAREMGPGFDVLRAVKLALDPNGLMNPGALGL